jgi:2-polyprenyl-6-methoxyphenol hydroxylase-like FAD-dependent oxidoreductase
MSRFHCDERQAPRYRVGRVFLAGDATRAAAGGIAALAQHPDDPA